MEGQRTKPPEAPSPPVLEYFTPPSDRPEASRWAGLVLFLSAAWVLVLGYSGVSSDRIFIPLPKKLALTAGSILFPFLLLRGGRLGCGFALGVWCLLSVFVMWFWN